MPPAYVIVIVWPALRESDETVIVWPETETVPTSLVTWPAPAASCGAVQPAGTSTVIDPLVIPPVGAVYVRVSVCAVPASTGVGDTDTGPAQSAALLATA